MKEKIWKICRTAMIEISVLCLTIRACSSFHDAHKKPLIFDLHDLNCMYFGFASLFATIKLHWSKSTWYSIALVCLLHQLYLRPLIYTLAAWTYPRAEPRAYGSVTTTLVLYQKIILGQNQGRQNLSYGTKFCMQTKLSWDKIRQGKLSYRIQYANEKCPR